MPMPRLHKALISDKQLIVDGLSLTVSDQLSVESINPRLQVLTVQIYCQEIVLSGDSHANPGFTPIWDQLIAERENLPDLSTTQGSIKMSDQTIPSKDVSTPEAILEAKRARDKETEK